MTGFRELDMKCEFLIRPAPYSASQIARKIVEADEMAPVGMSDSFRLYVVDMGAGAIAYVDYDAVERQIN